ncbi:MAG TPA: S9 family peptidase [Gaiellaceae bacterium]
MRPEDVYELSGAGDPRISPDGTRVAYVIWWIEKETSEYRSAIWVAPLDGSSNPVKFTSGERRDASPRWSPDGRRLAFISNRGKDEKTPGNLWVIPAEGGEARRLTDGKESVEKLAWSPDSTRIVFSSRVRDKAYEEEDDRKREPRRLTRLFYKLDSVGWTTDRRTHLFVVGVDGDEPAKQITDGDCEDGDPCWMPDGKRIIFPALRGDRWDVELITRLYVVDADGGEPTQLTGDDASFDTPAFSPDGSALAVRYGIEDGTFPHHGQIGVMQPDGTGLKLLTTSLDRQCTPFPEFREPIWDGDRIVFTVEDGGNTHLYAVAANGSSQPELLVGGERSISGYDVRGDTFVYVSSTHTTLRELFVGDRQVTNLTGDRAYLDAERFTAASKDGTEVDAWIVRPSDFDPAKKYPTLLSVHGGPFAQYGTGFFDEFQVYATAGYVVLFSNPRGGSGYSEEWGRAIRGPIDGGGPGWGTVDFEDVLGVVDTAVAKFDFVDADRLGIIGGSYGGFMTSWTISHDNRFKAAISERAVNHMVSAAGSSDLFWVFHQQFGGHWFDHVETWLELSPATYARNIETPVLVLHSENDLRCNVEQGEHLFTELRLLGKDVEMLRFPAESHELTRSGSPIHRVQRFEAVLDWFDRYLK